MKHRRFGYLLLALALSAGYPREARAQSRFTIQGGGGVSVPVGPLDDLSDFGSSLSATLAYSLTSRVALRVDFAANFLNGIDSKKAGIAGPDINFYQITGGLEYSFTNPETSRWNVIVDGGAGASVFDTDDFLLNDVERDFTKTYFTTEGGLAVGYNVSDNVDLFLKVQVYVAFTNSNDTAIFSEINPRVDPAGFDTATIIPITLGFRIKPN